MAKQGSQRRGGDAGDARSGAERRGAPGLELLANFVRQAPDGVNIEIVRQAQGFVTAERPDIGGLPVHISRIPRFDLYLLNHGRRRFRQIGKQRTQACVAYVRHSHQRQTIAAHAILIDQEPPFLQLRRRKRHRKQLTAQRL